MKCVQPMIEACRVLFDFLLPSHTFRPTAAGWWFILLTIAVGGMAINTGINLLYLILAMMLSFIIVSGVLSELSVWGIEVSLELPRHVFSGEDFRVGVAVRNKKRRCASCSLRLVDPLPRSPGDSGKFGYVVYVPPQQHVLFGYIARLVVRGIHRIEQVELRTAYPFGLFEKAYRLPVEASLIVYPALGRLRCLPPMITLRQYWGSSADVPSHCGGLEFYGLRGYRPGDNPRWIHWRTSARTGSLMVREFEREHVEGFNVVLDTSCSPGEGSAETRAFELAVSYAATLVHHTSAQGRRVCLVTWPASELVLTSDGSRGADVLLAHLAVAEPGVGRFDGGVWPGFEGELIPGAMLVLIRWGQSSILEPSCVFAREDGSEVVVVNVQEPGFRRDFVAPAAGLG